MTDYNMSQIVYEAAHLWPRPLEHARAIKTKPSQWEELKLKHIAYWRNRYGLDDFKPFRMVHGKRSWKANWHFERDERSLEPMLGIVYTELSKQVPDLTYKAYLSDISQFENALLARLAKFANSYGLILPSIHKPGQTGSVTLFAPFMPEHDWGLWRDDLVYTIGDFGGKVSKRAVQLAIDEYRRGVSPHKTLKELEEALLNGHISYYSTHKSLVERSAEIHTTIEANT